MIFCRQLARQVGVCMQFPCRTRWLFPQALRSDWAYFNREPITEPNRAEPNRTFGFSVFRFRFHVSSVSVFGFGVGLQATKTEHPIKPNSVLAHPATRNRTAPVLAQEGPSREAPRTCSQKEGESSSLVLVN